MTRENTRPLGVVYTPADVARPMTRLALAPLVEHRSSTEILALRVCDPAAGAGAFLVEVVAYLAEQLVAAWEREGFALEPTRARDARRMVVRTCVVGIDIDERALADAATALEAEEGMTGGHEDERRTVGREVEPMTNRRGGDRANGARVDDRARLLVADALSLDWRAAFPDIFASGGFDVVLANPPYIRQESLVGKSTLERFEVYDGVADLYVYFIELAHRLLRPRGRYCVIVPNKWMTVDYGRPLRGFLSDRHSVDGIVDLSQHALFADADAFPCIVWGTVGASHDRPAIGARASSQDRVEDVLRRSSAIVSRADDGMNGEALPTRTDDMATPRARWTAEPWHIDSATDRFLLDRLAASYPTLGEVIGMRWSRGVVTGLNDAFVIDRATRDALVSADLACAEWTRAFIKGRDIRSYVPDAIDRWLLLVDRGTKLELLPAPIREHLARFRERLEPRPAGHVGAWPGRKPGAYAWHELQDPVVPLARSRAPRLLYQDIQTAPACSLDADGELVPDTTVWILPSGDRYLLAILNSRLYHWYARRRFPPALNGAVRPKLAYMRRLPIPTPSADLRREIEAIVDRRLALREDEAARERDVLAAQIERRVEQAYELSSLERALVAS